MFAPKRFQMVRAGLPGITASVLTGRLGQLREAGVIAHDERLGLYSLTPMGRGLLPVLEALCEWALITPGHDPRRFISPSALMISMGVNLRRDRPPGTELRGGFDFGSEAFEARISDSGLRVDAVQQPNAPFILTGTGNALAFTVYGQTPLSEMISQGTAQASGDLIAAQLFIDLFSIARDPARIG